jgi:flagellar FliL protein
MAEEKKAEEAAPKSKKKLIIIIAAVALLGGGGGAAFFLMKPKAEGHEKKEEVHEEAAKPAFMTLETFTVNLVPDPGEQYLQADISLQIKDAHADQAIKDSMPLIKSSVLMVLSSKKSSEINTMEGKNALSKELLSTINNVLHPGSHEEKPHGDEKEPAKKEHGGKEHADKDQLVSGVFFTSFIIQ